MSTSIFEPCIQVSGPNKNVLLDSERATIDDADKFYTGDAEVYLRFFPAPRIDIGLRLDEPVLVSRKVHSVRLERRNLVIPVLVTGATIRSDGGTVLTLRPTRDPIAACGDDRTAVKSVTIHLFNFKEIVRAHRGVETDRDMTSVDLTCKNWRVELRSLPSTSSTVKQLKEQGGFGLTHIGRFEKAGRASFTGREAEELLEALRFFFSFTKGVWCEPICPVGYDASDNRVWESWSSPREPWHMPLSWFDPQHGSQLTTLFPGFMNRWEDEDWREALREVIYWYLNANNSARGIDVGIILTQTAIERLSYELAVKDRRLLTVKEFKDIWASDKFRLLFSTLGIALDIPAETSGLQRLASQMNWRDAPRALTEIRNSFVHPEHKQRGRFRDVYYEAWNLGLWYLEMSILAICGYSGSYRNRLKERWVGQVEDVPWKK